MMGTVPNRYPIQMNEIMAGLAGENHMGYYRGRQYWDATSGAVKVISQSPSFAEFPNLTNVAPQVLEATGNFEQWSTGTGIGAWTYRGFDATHGSLSPVVTSFGGTITAFYDRRQGIPPSGLPLLTIVMSCPNGNPGKLAFYSVVIKNAAGNTISNERTSAGSCNYSWDAARSQATWTWNNIDVVAGAVSITLTKAP
jgi:hypothetical protein